MSKKTKRLQTYDPLLLQGIAHRGLHDQSRPENSFAAFQAAIDQGCAFEFDIHLTKDGQLLVCHDSDLERVTGKKGIIETMTLEEIRAGYRLRDGSPLPTLEEVFALTNERVPVVIELKAYRKNAFRLVRAVKKRMKKVKNYGKYTFISFDPRCLLPLPHLKYRRGLLLTSDHEWVKTFRRNFEYLDVEDTMIDHPQIVSFAKKKPLNVWTIDSEEALKAILPKTDMVTFENIPLAKVREAIAKKQGDSRL